MGWEGSGKLALFIDGPNLHFTAKVLGFDIDFARLLAEFGRYGTLLRASYYTVLLDDNSQQTLRRLTDWLDYNGFAVKAKVAKEFDDGEGRRRFKRNTGVDLAIDAIEIAEHVDHIVLFSGDGDLRRLVEALQRRGRAVTVVSSVETRPAMVATELRRQADHFIELSTLRDRIGRSFQTLSTH